LSAVYPAEPNVLINIAKLLEKKLAIELQGTVLGEKQKEAELSAVEARYTTLHSVSLSVYILSTSLYIFQENPDFG
jgi:hypothetical protein